jgi:hypothetical protein
MMYVARLLVVFTLPLILLWGCARQPDYVTKDEPWRRVDETQCLQSGYVRESRYVHARSALGGPDTCGALQPFEMAAAASGTVQLVPVATLRCPMIPAVDNDCSAGGQGRFWHSSRRDQSRLKLFLPSAQRRFRQ